MAPPVEQRVVFVAQAEGLLRGLGADVKGRLKERLKAAELDPDRPFPPGWPAARLREWLDLASEELYPELPTTEAHRLLGRRFIEGWQGTLIGAASAQFLKLLGTRRALERLTRAFRTGDNYSETSVTFPSATSALVTVHSEPLVHYTAGILDAGLVMMKVKGHVTIERVVGGVMVFRMEWEAS
jgi:uncharacterized protein (TIGR02265 family)